MHLRPHPPPRGDNTVEHGRGGLEVLLTLDLCGKRAVTARVCDLVNSPQLNNDAVVEHDSLRNRPGKGAGAKASVARHGRSSSKPFDEGEFGDWAGGGRV